uniref:Transmembrane protein n=1 Tax=Medicago truncatula TaxID=3880 RepID=I3SVH5_MEDTR|nr:unknown [Medicago truncatula]
MTIVIAKFILCMLSSIIWKNIMFLTFVRTWLYNISKVANMQETWIQPNL